MKKGLNKAVSLSPHGPRVISGRYRFVSFYFRAGENAPD